MNEIKYDYHQLLIFSSFKCLLSVIPLFIILSCIYFLSTCVSLMILAMNYFVFYIEKVKCFVSNNYSKFVFCLRTRSLRLTRPPSWTSATKSSVGSTPTNWPRKRNTNTSKRSWRVFATQSSPSFTRALVVLPVECLLDSLVLAVQERLRALVAQLVPALPSRKWTKLQSFVFSLKVL